MNNFPRHFLVITLWCLLLAGMSGCPGKTLEQQNNNLASDETKPALVPYRKGEKWGYCDSKKKILIPPIYDSAGLFSEGLARIELKRKYGFIDETGKVVIPMTLAYSGDFHDGRSVVNVERLYGFIDKAGKVVIPAIYKTVTSFAEGFSVVKLPEGKFGYIDTSGKSITEPKYDEAYDFSEGLAMVETGPQGEGTLRYGFIDKTGKEVIPLIYTSANSFSDGLAQVQSRSTEKRQFEYYNGFIDKTGTTVIPFDYGWSPWSFSEGLAYVNVRETSSDLIIDKTGKVVIKDTPEYHVAAAEFHDGMAKVFMNDKIGYIDKTGKIVVPLIYDRIDSDTNFDNLADKFSGGVAVVCLGHKFGLIDKTGKRLTPFKYFSVPVEPKDGLIEVCIDKDCNKVGYVGRDGTEYFEP